MHGYLAWEGTTARSVIDEKHAMPAAWLAVPRALQETFGAIDPEAEPLIADALHIACADAHGATAFDNDIRPMPPTAKEPKLDRTEATADLLTDPALDPFGEIPEFKLCAVRLERSNRWRAAE